MIWQNEVQIYLTIRYYLSCVVEWLVVSDDGYVQMSGRPDEMAHANPSSDCQQITDKVDQGHQ